MLDIAAQPSYKNLMDALGKLSEWMESAGTGAFPSGKPPEHLVQQFNDALKVTNDASSLRADPIPSSPPPSQIIQESNLFKGNEISVDSDNTVKGIHETKRDIGPLTEGQKVNVEKGLDAIDHAMDKTTFLEHVNQLAQILAKNSGRISPHDLLQAQRIVGMLKIHAETGKQVSEGISDTFEQLLEAQG